jgi:hypothetical protein
VPDSDADADSDADSDSSYKSIFASNIKAWQKFWASPANWLNVQYVTNFRAFHSQKRKANEYHKIGQIKYVGLCLIRHAIG